jgi:hypothetical protein
VARIRLPSPELRVVGERVPSSSHLLYSGGYQLTLSTVVPELALELHSSYLGHPDGETAVSHLQLRPDEPPATLAELQPGRSMPVRKAKRLCLYDHLATLRELVADTTAAEVRVEVADRALEVVDLA